MMINVYLFTNVLCLLQREKGTTKNCAQDQCRACMVFKK